MSQERPTRLRLFVHQYAGVCRRVMYALNFKGVSAEIVDVDLMHPSEEFKAVAFNGMVPALQVWYGNRTVNLVESLLIIEFLDTVFPGPPLYPRTPDNTLDVLAKAVLDVHIKNHIETMVPNLRAHFYGTATEKHVKELKAQVQTLNDKFLVEGGNFAHATLGNPMVSIGDLALLPFAEFLNAGKETVFADVFNTDFPHFWKWFDQISDQPWAARDRPTPRMMLTAQRLISNGTYPKLTLPYTLYH